ncbi:MAG TPA: exodeoxyribonuclease VII large subunit [Solirubrobacteraceae bacterium]|nr:exodeoxyribonuclease VII large subunit [Solirubrobacteraceae bacterium]
MAERPAGIPGSTLTGPWPVGHYAAALREQLRGFTRVQVFGEVFSFKAGRAKVWFELRDGVGALPCSMWRKDFEALGLEPLADGVQVVAAGGCDYYPGSRTASPAFSFAVGGLRIAGEGDLLAQLERLRRALHAEGLFEPQKRLARRSLPRCLGVVCGEHGKARDDMLAGLRRRGWGGRVVWAFAPVQDRHAAPAITRALQDLAACPEVEAIVVARGGGSLADLFAFCDETLCRTVALLRVPVISSVGHHTDRTLLDDVAAVACSTPTHAAEAAVPLDCVAARRALGQVAVRLDRQARRAIVERARTLARLSRAPAAHVARHRAGLHQHLRELRAGARRGIAGGERLTGTRAATLARKAQAASAVRTRGSVRARADAASLDRGAAAGLERRRRDLDRLVRALAAHDPQRTLERGYALVEEPDGAPVSSAAAARAAPDLVVRLHDGRVPVRPHPRVT